MLLGSSFILLGSHCVIRQLLCSLAAVIILLGNSYVLGSSYLSRQLLNNTK